jgi:hypothetical protein
VTVDVDGGEATLTTKSITVNGTYAASVDNADGYSSVTVAVENSYTAQDEGKVVSSGALVAQSTHKQISANGTGIDTTNYSSVDVEVPNSYSAGDEGKVVQSGALVAQTATTATTNGTIDTTTNNSIVVNVANSYVAADEGKVVSNGVLVAQGSDSVTENGTVDTTLISSLTVNVQGGGTGVPVKLTTINENIISSDLYIVDAGSYIYVYGEVVAPGGNGAKDILFDIPPSFPIDTVGNFIESGYHQYGTSNQWIKNRIRISKTAKCVYFNSSNSSSNPPKSDEYLTNTMHMFGIYEKI